MIVDQVQHWPTCRADYPEKVIGELPRQLISIDIGDGETALVCVDCGASVIFPEPVRIDAKAAFAELPVSTTELPVSTTELPAVAGGGIFD